MFALAIVDDLDMTEQTCLIDKALGDRALLALSGTPSRHAWPRRGVDLATLAKILGHNSIRVVDPYVHPTDEHKKSAMVRYEAAQIARADAGRTQAEQAKRPN
jgi:hypothetical protein